MLTGPARATLWICLAVVAPLGCAQTADSPAAECRQAFPPTYAQALHRKLRTHQHAVGCRLEGVETRRFEIVVTWSDDAGSERLTTVTAVTAATGDTCAPDEPGSSNVARATIGSEAQAACPGVAAALDTSLGELRGVALITLEADAGLADTEPGAGLPLWPQTVYVQGVLPALWFALLLAGGLALWRRRRLLLTRDAAILGGILTLALLLRLLLPPGGPGNNQFGMNQALEAPSLLTTFGTYGRGMDSLLALLGRISSGGDGVVIAAVLGFALATLPALYALTRRLGYGRPAAHLAALLLAVAPLHVRFSITTSRYIPLVFLTLIGWALLLAWLDERRLEDLVAATAALTLAPQFRPDLAFLPLLTLGLLLAVGGMRRTRRGKLHALGWAGALHAVLLVLPFIAIATNLDRGLASYDEYAVGFPWRLAPTLVDPAYNALLHPHYALILAVPLALLGALSPPARGRWGIPIGLLLFAGLAAVLTAVAPHAGGFLDLRHQLVATAPWALLTAVGLVRAATLVTRRREQLRGPVFAVAGLALAGSAAFPLPIACRPTATEDEYWALRRLVASVPDGCHIIQVHGEMDPLLAPEANLSRSEGRRHTWATEHRLAKPEGATCAVMYRGAKCAVLEAADVAALGGKHRIMRDFCGEMAGAAAGEVGRESLPARPELLALGVAGGEMEVGMYWLSMPTRPMVDVRGSRDPQ